MTSVTSTYCASSEWTIDCDLSKAYDWYIKWDVLYVKEKDDDSEYEEYSPDYCAVNALREQTLKRPSVVLIDGEVVR